MPEIGDFENNTYRYREEHRMSVRRMAYEYFNIYVDSEDRLVEGDYEDTEVAMNGVPLYVCTCGFETEDRSEALNHLIENRDGEE